MKKIKILGALCMAAVMLLLNSCKKDTEIVTHLLSSVPSSAAGVVVINSGEMLEDVGCKVSDGKVKLSKEMENFLNKLGNSDSEDLKMFLDGSLGIDQKCAVLFFDSGRSFATFELYDVAKFCNYVEENSGSKFTEESGVKINGNIAVKGSQGWICLTRRMDADLIGSYADLTESRSFLVTDMGQKLLVEENAVRGWASLNVFLDEMLDRSERSMVTMGLGFVFADAGAIDFKLDFKKGELDFESMILNDNNKPAKYQFPDDKIDVSTLKKLGDNCDALMAFTINKKLIDKFQQVSALFGGSLLGNLEETMKNIDGTVGIAASGNNLEGGVSGLITTKGEISQSLRDLISELGTVSEEGKYVMFKKGELQGSMSVSEAAEELKGCCLGMVVNTSSLNNNDFGNFSKGFSTVAVKLNPKDGGIEFEMELTGTDKNENSLLTLLKNM